MVVPLNQANFDRPPGHTRTPHHQSRTRGSSLFFSIIWYSEIFHGIQKYHGSPLEPIEFRLTPNILGRFTIEFEPKFLHCIDDVLVTPESGTAVFKSVFITDKFRTLRIKRRLPQVDVTDAVLIRKSPAQQYPLLCRRHEVQ